MYMNMIFCSLPNKMTKIIAYYGALLDAFDDINELVSTHFA